MTREKWPNLKKWRDEIYSCWRCGSCRQMVFPEAGVYKICPVREVKRWDSYTARGYILIARALLEGKLKLSDKLISRIYSCLLCGNCKAHCPGREIDTPSIVRVMRQDIVNMGRGPPEAMKLVDKNVKEAHNVFGEKNNRRADWSKDLNLPNTGDTVYFAGCYASYRYPEIARATISILREAKVEVAYLADEEWCCGLPQLQDGSIGIAENMMKHNIDIINASGAEKVITACPGCYTTMKREYPKVVGKLPFKVVHISEVIADLLKEGKIKTKNPIEKTVTYHDSCHLGRSEGVYEPPRNALRAIPNLKLKEMVRNRENAWCCGGGIVYNIFPDLTKEIADTRVKEAIEIEAEAIITTCPMCMHALKPAAKKAGIQIQDLSVIVAESIKSK